MKIVINKCWGGFGLSVRACLRYADLAGFKLYMFTEQRDSRGRLDFEKFRPLTVEEAEEAFLCHYAKSPLAPDGSYNKDDYWYERDLARNDPILVQVVEEMGAAANGQHAELEVVEIPDDVQWEIDEYDGQETIHEVHRSWR